MFESKHKYYFKEEFIMNQIQNFTLLSKFGKECLRLSQRELLNFKNLKLIKEISINEAKRLGVYSEGVISNVEVYMNEKSSNEEKIKALESVKKAYVGLVSYVRKFYRRCFEPRMVFLMCEARMISAGIMPGKIAEKIKEVEDNEYAEDRNNF